MVFYKDLDKRKETVRNYIREHPYTTFREIKKVLHIKINKVYSGGMEEAYKDSGVNLPRTFKRMTGEEKRKIIIDYIKSHPMVGGHTLKRDIKINYQTIFPNIKDAFDAAGILYPQRTAKRLRQKTSDEIIKLIRENPHITLVELMKKSHTNLYLSFKSLREAYQRANIVYMGKGAKRKLNKQEQVINFIKKNSFATQREINCACRTHV
ncbi:MAG: hypothetical protein Q8L29_03340, partial [archaeon]|nr:hypothetical protein [archaeon]